MAYTNIDDPSAHFQTKVYTGSNANQSITNDGNSNLQPDWIFASYRTLPPYTNHRAIIDSSRGRAKILESDTNAVEATTTNAAYDLVSFDTDGFTVGAVNSTSGLNASGISHVAWQWKANGGTTSTDTTSSITSTVQVNSDAGFSIVTYTGDGTTTGGFGHGLGVAPSVVFVKRRNTAADWAVYHKDIGAANFLKLSTTEAQQSGVWQGIDPSSTRVTVYQGGFVNGNGDDYVAYCFAEKQGYSKFGKYVGNGSTDGPFIYTGFKPAWVMAKKSSNLGPWAIVDNKRNPFNVSDKRLFADDNTAESTTKTAFDFLSNGFKLRDNNSSLNASGSTYIYMAFAENPFVTSTGIMGTAR
jgi:hypothetical protein